MPTSSVHGLSSHLRFTHSLSVVVHLAPQIGTFPLAMVAKAFNKPLYVAVESYKFARLYPLNQLDLPEKISEQRPLTLCQPGAALAPGVETENPACDYTPANYITLLFTDLGILTPAAVSDELIRLYQ